MKPLIIFLSFIVILPASVYSQQQVKPYKWPGFVQLNDSVFISEKEISITEYAEYLSLLKRFFGSYENLEEAMPSPNYLNWIAYNPFDKYAFPIGNLFEVSKPDSFHYIKRKKPSWFDTSISYLAWLRDYPMVNVTKKQALHYCEMRTRAFEILKQNTRKDKRWRLPDRVYFRLPSLEEYNLAHSDPTEHERRTNKKKKDNSSSEAYWKILAAGSYIPLPVYNGPKNRRGLIHLCGNVSEMLMDSPFAHGGSFRDSIETCSKEYISMAAPPQSDIGFRIVAVIVK